MTLYDDDHEAARIIKQLEERISNLEEGGRSGSTPNPLIKQTEQAGSSDRVDDVRATPIETLRWDQHGWNTAAWGNYGWS